MKVVIIFAIFFLKCVLVAPEKQFLVGRGFNDKVKQAIENIKKRMPCGIPELDVPILAPFKNTYTEVEYDNILFSILGVFIDTQIDGLNDFKVIDISLSPLTLKAKFDFNFNKLNATGDYVMNLFLINIMKITGRGKLDIFLEDLRIQGDLQIGANDNGLYMRKFDITIVLGHIKSNISGLLGGGLAGKLANRAIEEFTMYVIRSHQSMIQNFITEKIVPKINENLGGKTIQEFLDMIEVANEPVECIPPEKKMKFLNYIFKSI